MGKRPHRRPSAGQPAILKAAICSLPPAEIQDRRVWDFPAAPDSQKATTAVMTIS